MIMNTNSAAMPMTSAVTPFSMFSWPSCGPMTRSLAMEIGRRQRAAAQQQRGLARLVHREAGGLEAVAEHAVDGRDVDDRLFLDVAHRPACRRPRRFRGAAR